MGAPPLCFVRTGACGRLVNLILSKTPKAVFRAINVSAAEPGSVGETLSDAGARSCKRAPSRPSVFQADKQEKRLSRQKKKQKKNNYITLQPGPVCTTMTRGLCLQAENTLHARDGG